MEAPLRALALLLTASILTACTSAPPPATAPQWTSVPPVILEAFCAKLHSEAISSDSQVVLVRTTQPLASASSLRSVAHLYDKDADAGALAQAINEATPFLPLDVEGSRSCSWQPVDRIDPLQHADTIAVELSSPFVNPFTRGESGMLARMSIAGRDAQWYWIPLAERKGVWAIGLILPTDMHE